MRPSRLGILLSVLGLVGTVLAVRLVDRGGPDPGLAPSQAQDRPGRVTGLSLPPRLVALPGTALLRTRVLEVPTYSLVGLTWSGAAPPGRAEVRTRAGRLWSDWRELEPLADLGDEGDGVRGSELLWVDDAQAAQVRVRGRVPRDAELVLIDPGRLATDAAAALPEPDDRGTATTDSASDALTLSAAARPTSAPRPGIHTRRAWGADESWRNGEPRYGVTIKQVHVHHTASGSVYAGEDVPGIIRGMYRYHTQSLGWSDIGYNFLVDRFGRSWMGRYGGWERPVRGAHTLGFNHNSVGIALIGSFERHAPRAVALTALVRLAAWKLDKYDRNPAGRIRVMSGGSDLYPARTIVRLPVIDGHRDTNRTACPGRRLYAQLPDVRQRAQRRADYYS